MKPIEVGDILVATWGYDACLATFYKVVGRTAKSLKIAKILQNINTGDWCAGTAAPKPDSDLGPVMTKRICVANWKGEEYVSVNDSANAYPWIGIPINTYNHH
jgi:hypothetical protein